MVPRRIWLLVGVLALAAGVLFVLRHKRPPTEQPVAGPSPHVASRAGDVRLSPPPAPIRAALAPEACPIRLREVTDESGIDFQHVDGSSGAHYIIESMTAGLATFDYDRDGLMDIYFPNGAPLPGTAYARQPRHALYKNLGGWRFREVAGPAGLTCTAFGVGSAVCDYDNDGWPDVYLNNLAPNLFFQNNGDGTFSDVTNRAGVAGTTPGGPLANKAGAGVCFLDYDADGNPDLFVGNYLELDLSTHVAPVADGLMFYPWPLGHAPGPSSLSRNAGDGTFADVSGPSGIAARRGRCMGLISADYDGDGRPDLFVCNDLQENFLFRNTGRGRFEEVALLAAVALSPDGQPLANMGVDCGDFDNDGRLDFFTTNYQAQLPMLLRNTGDGMFEDVTLVTGAGSGSFPYVKWGCAMVDFDNDGHKDLFIANGHIEDNIDPVDRSTAYRNHNALLWNTGTGKFVDVSGRCGLRAVPVHAARGVAFDDLDNDGDVDVAVLNSRERPTLLRNMLREQSNANHWLQVRLQGVKTNRHGVGARVRVTAAGLVQTDEVHSGRGYQSHWGSRLHFGLGKRDRIDRVEIRWTGGGVDVLENLPADRSITVTEGRSRGVGE